MRRSPRRPDRRAPRLGPQRGGAVLPRDPQRYQVPRDRCPRRPGRPASRRRPPRTRAARAVLPRRPAGLQGPRRCSATPAPREGRCATTGRARDAERGSTSYVHAPYIVNVATTNNRIRIPSRKLLQQHVDAAAAIGAKGLIVHGGHVNKDDDPAKGFDNWRKAVEATDLKLPLLIENTAGGDNAMTRYLDRISGVWEAISAAERLRPGRLLPRHLPRPRRRQRLETVVEDVRTITGRIDLVHCNDSRDDFDSGADRHANLGAGRIDPDLLAAVVRDAGAPVVCETPGGPAEHSPTSTGCASALAEAAGTPGPGEQPRPLASPGARPSGRRVDLRPRSTSSSCAAARSASFLQTPAWGAGQAGVARASRSAGSATAPSCVGAGPGALPPAAARSSATSPTCPRARSSTGPTDDLAAWLRPDGRATSSGRAPSASGWARRW